MFWFCSAYNPKVRKNLNGVEKTSDVNTEIKNELGDLKKKKTTYG